MSTIWDNLGEQIRTWTSTAAEKAGTFTRAAAHKAGELSKVGRLKMDVYQLQRERTRAHAELGTLAYQSLNKPTGPALKDQPGVEDLRLRLAELGKKIAAKDLELQRASDREQSAKTEAAARPRPKAKPPSTAGTGKGKSTAARKQAAPTTAKPAARKAARPAGAKKSGAQ